MKNNIFNVYKLILKYKMKIEILPYKNALYPGDKLMGLMFYQDKNSLSFTQYIKL